MLPTFLSKPTWCPKSTIATACCTASQINYWIVFSEFRTMLLGWSSGCTNSAISHQHWPHYTGSLSIAGSTGSQCSAASAGIDFKIALLVYKALNGQAPAYIIHADPLQPHDPPRKLRSVDKHLLSQPPCRLKSYGDRAFCCAAAVVWNDIPHSVKTAKTVVDNFKLKLKTHFYSV